MAITRIKSSNIEDGTVANVDIADLDSTKLTGTIATARLSNVDLTTLSATNLTSGTIPDARIPASAVTQHVAATDLTPVKNDISLLALQNAINGNLSAYGLKNSWIEQFENSTYIENLSTAQRNVSSEYVSSTVASTTFTYLTGDRRSRITATQTGWGPSAGSIALMVAGNIGEDSSNAILGTAISDNTGDVFHYDFGTAVAINEFRWYRNATTTIGNWQFSGSANADHSSSVNLGSPVLLGGTASGAHPGIPQVVTAPSANTTAYRYYRLIGTGGTSTGNNWDSEIEFKEGSTSSTLNATGSFNSTDVVPQDAVNKSSVGIVILYKDQAGTTTFNGANQLVAKVRANTGQAYQEVVLAGAGTYSDGLKIAIAPAIAVTAGQALSYEISFAGQSASLETRVHGVAMTY